MTPLKWFITALFAVFLGVVVVAVFLTRNILNESERLLPPHTVVGQQGIARMIVVPPDVAGDDAALWQIANYLRLSSRGQMIQAMFWTDHATAARRLPMDDAAMASQIARSTSTPTRGTGN